MTNVLLFFGGLLVTVFMAGCDTTRPGSAELPKIPAASQNALQVAVVLEQGAAGPALVVRAEGLSRTVGSIQGRLHVPFLTGKQRAIRSGSADLFVVNDRDLENGYVRFAGLSSIGAIPEILFSISLGEADLRSGWTEGVGVEIDVAGDVAGNAVPRKRILARHGVFGR